MKRAPRSRQRHDLYAKYHDYDSEISDLLGECGDQQAYPQSFHPRQLLDSEAEDDRQGWFTFFALGMFRSMGRTIDGQHRSFVEEAQRQGWWTDISKAGAKHAPEAWLKWLQDVAAPDRNHISYLPWHRRIVDLHLLTCYLPDYVMAFQRLPFLVAQKGAIRLGDALAPSASHDWARLGLEGGPLRQSLGIGVNWMIRESLRHGLWTGLDAERMRPYAWAASGRLRNLLAPFAVSGLGDQADMDASGAIYQMVKIHLKDRATFNGDFDLPLQISATQGSALSAHLEAAHYLIQTIDMPDEELAE